MKSLRLSRIVNRVTAGRVKYGWWSAPWTSAERPIVIGGASRSGTTLLKSLLNAHRDVMIGPETGIFNTAPEAERLAGHTGFSVDEVQRIIYRSPTLGDFFQRLNTAMMVRDGKKVWGEKTPSNIRHIAAVFRAFPRARFIHALRDGRDATCSLRTHPKYRWENGARVETGVLNPWPECVQHWVVDVSSALPFRGDARYVEVRYESLVADPERTLRGLLAWLELHWDPELLTRPRNDRALQQPRLPGPIDAAVVGRWRRDLSAEGRGAFRGEASRLLHEFGYAADDSWIDEEPEPAPCHTGS